MWQGPQPLDVNNLMSTVVIKWSASADPRAHLSGRDNHAVIVPYMESDKCSDSATF